MGGGMAKLKNCEYEKEEANKFDSFATNFQTFMEQLPAVGKIQNQDQMCMHYARRTATGIYLISPSLRTVKMY